MPAKTIGSKTSEETIQKRTYHFAEFLNLLVNDDDFKSCNELNKFLSLNEKEFENFKNTFGFAKPVIPALNKIVTKNGPVYDISGLTTCSGTIDLSISQKNHCFLKEIKRLIYEVYPVYDEVNSPQISVLKKRPY